MSDSEEVMVPDAVMPSADQVTRTVNLLLPEGEVVGLVDWRPCYASDVWIFDTTVGRVVAKVRRFAEEDPSQIEGQRRAQAVLAAAGFATPNLIALEASSSSLGGRQVSVLDFVDGIAGDRAICLMRDSDRDRLFVDLGRWTGVLHELRIPAFGGWVDDDGRRHQTWGDVLAAIVERAMHDLDAYAAPLPLAHSRELTRRLTAFVDSSAQPVPSLVHRDIHLGNVVVSNGNLTSMLDFEMVREWDAAWEFPKVREFVFQKYDRSEELFMDGYRASTIDHSVDLAVRVWLYEGLRYLTCTVDHLEGNRIYSGARRKFEDWIISSPPV